MTQEVHHGIFSNFPPKDSDEGGDPLVVEDTTDIAVLLRKNLNLTIPELLRAAVAQFVTQLMRTEARGEPAQ